MRLFFSFLWPFVVLYGWNQWQSGALRPSRSPASVAGNTCSGKTRCTVLYITPWCPYCRAEIPYAQAILAKSKTGTTGVRVVVGQGRAAGDNEAMAQKIASQGVEIDSDSKIARRLGVSGVPAYFVLDAEGSKILEGGEAYAWVREKFGN